MIELVARVSTGRRSKWVVVGAWLALAVGFGVFGARIESVLRDQAATADALPDDVDSARVSQVLRERFPGGEPFVTAIVHRRDGGLTDGDRAAIARLPGEVEDVPHAGPPTPAFAPAAVEGLVSRDGTTAISIVPLLTTDAEERTEAIEELRSIVEDGPEGLEAHVTGTAALQSDLSTALAAVDIKLLVATGLLVLVLLVAIYRSPVLALIPLVVVGISLVVAAGIIYLGAQALDTTVDRTASSLLAVLVFGAGTDYCLLLVARYVQNLRRIEDEHEAVRQAIPIAGPAIAASAATVCGALLVLLVSRLDPNRVLGPVNAVGVAVVFLASVTLLPALLAIAGRRGFWPSRGAVALDDDALPRAEPALLPGLAPLPAALRASAQAGGVVGRRPSVWGAVGARVLRRPVLALVLTVPVFLVGALGLLGASEDLDLVAQFRETTDATEGFDAASGRFPPGTLYPATVLLERDGGRVSDADAAGVRARLGELPGVASVGAPNGRAGDGSALTLPLTVAGDPFEAPALATVERARREVARPAEGLRVRLADGPANRVDYRDASRDDRLRVIPLVLAVILLTLIALLRSIVAPLFLLATVVMSYAGTLGFSSLFFEGVLGHEGLEPSVPLLGFIFLVALGVDYNIFLMTAVREEAVEHGTRVAIVRAVGSTGPVITSAGVVLAGTFAVLMTLPLQVLLQLGFLVALGVLLDTFLVRTILVPALAGLAGERTWWPSRPAKAGSSTSY